MRVYEILIWIVLRGLLSSAYGETGLQGPPLVTGEMIPILANVGSNVKIDCPIDSSSSLKVYYDWKKDGETITSAWDRFRVSDRKLRIKGVLAEDGGLYQCKGTNGFGSKELSTRLLVQDEAGNVIGGEAESTGADLKPGTKHLFPDEILGERPTFSEISAPPPGSSTFRQAAGSSLTLRCRVDGKPFPSITWIRLKDDVQIPRGNGQELELTELKYEDSGVYVCIGSNIYGQVNASFIIEVFERGTIGPTIISLEPSNLTVARGQLIHFRCLIKSDTSEPSVQWLRELGDDDMDSKSSLQVGDVRYRVITTGSRVSSFQNGTYLGELLVQTDLRDSGFVCLATNAGGFKYERSILSVLPVVENGTLFPIGILLVAIPASLMIVFTSMALVICCIRRRRDPSASNVTTTATYATPRDAMNNDYQPPPNSFYNTRPPQNQHSIRIANGTNCPINRFNSQQYYAKENLGLASPIKNHHQHASPAYASVPICDPTTTSSTFGVRGPPLPSRPAFNNPPIRDRNCYNNHGVLTQPLLTQTASSSDSHDSRQSGGVYLRGPEFSNANFPIQRDHWCTVNSSGGSEGSWDRKNLRNPHQIRL